MLDKELSFKEQQLEYYRVEHAYRDAGEEAFARLRAANIDVDSFDLFIRAFKFEEDLEVWAKNKTDSSFSLVTSYKFCSNVGDLGPKRKEGDKQIPEGFYSLSEFNHNSVYFLSLKVDYPNASDSILSDQRSPGGMIFIHGGCRTIGCIPITDRWIKELYVYAVEAKNGGQEQIPIHIFPTRMSQENMSLLEKQYDEQKVGFWRQLREGYSYFESSKQLPIVHIDSLGVYSVQR